ncbi:hypothetical protein OV090_08170 [Nannocystis sp. RBIL2]|uniref:hypothetical protein n=1 Tax=Nannocystis sp. RBIL2 TaxID=2996788 RepID=UPI0022706137|nr:hypothetical protein [Nannocystis sp. RBIL2]MCY1064734.1 hypothetical protein [Nannocystis sp. RBIL2]
MTILRSVCLGLLAAVVIVLVLVAAQGYGDDRLYWLLLLPLLALHCAAVFSPIAGWRRRLVRGALGFAGAAAAGFATYACLAALTDWFRGMDDARSLLLVVLHAAVPGGTAAAADSPGRGLALAGGLTLGLGVAGELAGNAHPGYTILLAVGTLTGALFNALDRGRPRAK